MHKNWVIGVDFGTASIRGLLIDANSGVEVFSTEEIYPRWAIGMYCEPEKNQYRQHPLDYIETLTKVLKSISEHCGEDQIRNIKSISIDTTGSTPGPVDEYGQPLALSDEFTENPNAMFFLWKDHTSKKEADEINLASYKLGTNYLRYVGGAYSSEWFWAKLIHAFRCDDKISKATVNWVEHCDWIPFLLTGGNDHNDIKRGSCAAGHKALWATDINPNQVLGFMQQIEPKLNKFNRPLYKSVYPATHPVGKLSDEWAGKTGLHNDILIGIGSLDAHAGALGGEISKGTLIKVMGTSTCDMMVAENFEMKGVFIKSISGQAEDSIIPGMVGLEAGQSAFGDAFDWFTKTVTAPTKAIIKGCNFLDKNQISNILATIENSIFIELEKGVAKIQLSINSPQALDWLNGRRTPDNNPNLKATWFNLDLATNASHLYLSLIESTCFGARRIVETFNQQGLKINCVIALGGIAQKSPFIMQFMADSLGLNIKIHASLNTCALGSAMYASVVAGIYPTVTTSQKAMGKGFIHIYKPDISRTPLLDQRYKTYLSRGSFEESELSSNI